MTALSESFPLTIICDVFYFRSWLLSLIRSENPFLTPPVTLDLMVTMPPWHIYVPNSGNLQLHVLQYSHDQSPLQVIWSDEDPPSSLHAILLVQTSSLHQNYCKSCTHLFPCQTCAPQTLWTSQATSDSQEALEIHIHGFHREAPSILVTPWV